MKINKDSSISIFVLKLIESAVNLLDSIDYDYDEEDEYAPCFVRGVFDPNLARAELRRAQAMIFGTMRDLKMPLCGWSKFDNFIHWLRKGFPVEEAYILRDVEDDISVAKEGAKGPIKAVQWHEPDTTQEPVNGGWTGWWIFIH